METQLKEQTVWAVKRGVCWVVALRWPMPVLLLQWVVENYGVVEVKSLRSGNLALKLTATTPRTVAALEQLPRPKGQGSRHESNYVML